MQKYQDVVLNQNGEPVLNAQISVTDTSNTPVTVYAVNDTSTSNVNPVSTDVDGRFFFYAPDGRYNLFVSISGTVVATITDILLEDPAGPPAVVTTSDLSASSGSSLIGYLPSGAGAVATTVQSKLREWVSVADFGATGSGDESAEFQAAVDVLPAEGGLIVVPVGDYSATVPGSITIPADKYVTWIAIGATLPDDMPGNVIVSGYRNQPYENSAGTGSRPGDSFYRFIVSSHTPDTAQASQQDSVVYIEGHSPAVEANLAQEFAALRFNMSSQMFDSLSNPSDCDIKGIQGVTVGDTGNAKVRSVRTTSVGINGHYGLVTGAMFAAHRSGVIPTEAPFSGNGTDEWASGDAGPYLSGDAAIIGQVGPGIQAVFRAEGFAGTERPQVGFLQARGAQGLLPEVAMFDLHAGGNGKIIRILVSESDSTELAAWERDGVIRATGFYSQTQTIADDAAITITPPSTSGFIKVWAEATTTAYGERYYRVGASPGMAIAFSGSVFASTTGPLTGTTGTDGNLTISAKTDGTIDIENRTGASRTIVWKFDAR